MNKVLFEVPQIAIVFYVFYFSGEKHSLEAIYSDKNTYKPILVWSSIFPSYNI